MIFAPHWIAPYLVPKGTCKFTVTKNRMSVSWQRATNKICFASERLRGIMSEQYSPSHNCVVAYINVVAADQYWGPLQVIPLKACVTGSPTEAFLPYPTTHTKEWKGKDYRQFNTLCHCMMQLMKQHFSYMAHA
jgi:hypothetical protein